MSERPSPVRRLEGEEAATHHRRLENLYHEAPCNRHYRPRAAVDAGRATVRIPVRDELHHAARALHGSVYFKAMDDASFFAANSLVPDVFVLTAGFHVDLIRPVTEGVLRAEAKVVHAGRSRLLAEAVVYNDPDMETVSDTVAGRGHGTFMPSPIRLTPDVGYADRP